MKTLGSAGLALIVAASAAGAGEWPESSPEAQSVDASVLESFHQELSSGKHGYVDGILVIRNGHVVFEKSYRHDYDRLFPGGERGAYNYYDPDWHPYYQRGPFHTMQSVTKSVTSALIGIAVGKGAIPDLDAKVLPLLEGFRRPSEDPRWTALTIRDLLTMTSGIEWDETTVSYTDPANSCARMEGSEDWVQFVLDRKMAAEPGKVFNYNSGVTMLLGQVVKSATGKDPEEYAREELFRPLGIEGWYWKKTPTGLSDTEGGLYLAARDLAKIGALFLKDGVWDGKRLLPSGWVAQSIHPAVVASSTPGNERKYGYQWWLLPYQGREPSWAQAGLGYGGQFLFVVPEYDLVAVFTGWNIYDGPTLPPPPEGLRRGSPKLREGDPAALALERVMDAVRHP